MLLVTLVLMLPQSAFGDQLFDDSTLAKIATAVLKLGRCQAVNGCEMDSFRFYPVDVNADGEREYIVVSLEDCGSAGCATTLVMKREGRWKNIAEVLGSIRVERSQTNGFYDVTLSYKEYIPSGGFQLKETRLVWDGTSQYRGVQAGQPSGGALRVVLRWPLDGKRLERQTPLKFGDPWLPDHLCNGARKRHVALDIQANVGEPVYAAEAGAVVAVFNSAGGNDTSWGRAITLEHGGFTTTYHHVNPGVRLGSKVGRGEAIASVFNMPSHHLHFGIRLGSYVAPVSNRGALPVKNSNDNDSCRKDPVFSAGDFIDPALEAYEDASVASPSGQISLAVSRLPVPQAPTRRVNDYAGVLVPADRQRLEELLAERERATKAQMVVALFRSLQGENLEQYTLRVAKQWKIGRVGVDDGVVLFVFLDDRRMRLEIGTGLEGVITNAEATRILSEVVAPRFREGQVAAGIEGAVDAVYRRITGQTRRSP